MILYLALVAFAVLLARMLGAGPRVRWLIPVVAVAVLIGLWLLPESNPYAVDMATSLRQLGWIAAFMVPVGIYAWLIRHLRQRTGVRDAGLHGAKPGAPRGLVRILEDEDLRADTRAELTAESVVDSRRTSFAWRSDEGPVVGHLALGMLGGSADLEMLHVKPDYRGRGTGTDLLAAGETEAREWGALRMTAIVGSWQDRPFLEKRGYRTIGEQDLSDGVARYWMEKDLA